MGENSSEILNGKLAVVTGGGGGIGRSICNVFAREGATVVVADINQTAGEETLNSLERSSHHLAQEVDVALANSVTQLFDAIHKKYHRYPEVIVNCAGIAGDVALLHKTTEKNFDNVINVNLKGTFLVTQAALRAMLAEKITNGSIINISSLGAQAGVSTLAIYTASKAAMIGLTKTIAAEMAEKGIRCNAVLPALIGEKFHRENVKGFIENRIPMKRCGEPEEVAEMCAFLASDKSSYITGAEIKITGGL